MLYVGLLFPDGVKCIYIFSNPQKDDIYIIPTNKAHKNANKAYIFESIYTGNKNVPTK